jgi:DnaJ-class molecular chaperone
MASRNYYVVLGVTSNESARGIRAAFRDLAKRYHPDRMGASGIEPFREVVEAYATLGDPARRNQYDESLLRPADSRPLTFRREASLRRDFAELRPSEEALFQRFARNFTGVDVPKAETVEQLTAEVAISREEAATGTRVRVGVPIFAPCARCIGRGCGACGGQGLIERERLVTVDIPPMSGSGTTFLTSLRGLGIHNLYVRVRVRVEAALEPPPRAG